jgi:hypothetical protein
MKSFLEIRCLLRWYLSTNEEGKKYFEASSLRAKFAKNHIAHRHTHTLYDASLGLRLSLQNVSHSYRPARVAVAPEPGRDVGIWTASFGNGTSDDTAALLLPTDVGGGP